MSRLKQALRKMRLEVRRARAAMMRCHGCSHRNVIVIDDYGVARCAHCGHKPSAYLLGGAR